MIEARAALEQRLQEARAAAASVAAEAAEAAAEAKAKRVADRNPGTFLKHAAHAAAAAAQHDSAKFLHTTVPDDSSTLQNESENKSSSAVDTPPQKANAGRFGFLSGGLSFLKSPKEVSGADSISVTAVAF